MGRKKIIYFSLLFILVVICTITYFSYAFLIKTEEHHGKLNIVTGTLKYGLTSENLTNNSITVGPGKTELKLVLRSLNKIDSKYQLYYQAATGVVVGYPDTNLSTGIIQANDQITILLVINNTTDSNQTVTFGVQGGFTGNELVLAQGTAITEQISLCDYTVGQVFTFDYTGSEQIFSPECDGMYKVELWGASGSGYNSTYPGGKGAYTKGNIGLSQNEKLHIYVGGYPGDAVYATSAFNGGTAGFSFNGADINGVQTEYTGGGATDIRLVGGNWDDSIGLNSRIMVAAAGGGGGYISGRSCGGIGGAAGGITGYDGINNCAVVDYGQKYIGYGALQYNGGSSINGIDTFVTGGFGKIGYPQDASLYKGGGGGSGYYTGGGATRGHGASGGGSSYISGFAKCLAIKESSTSLPRVLKDGCTSSSTSVECATHYSEKIFIDSVMIDGKGCNWSTGSATNCGSNQPQPDGTTAVGHTGNGYAKITYLGKSLKSEILADNTLITATPTLNNTSVNTSDASGLYKMSVTNGFGGSDGDTYYFRGEVSNNYVDFAGMTWRIVRINEDGTIRLILNNGINDTKYAYKSSNTSYSYVYYSNSDAKTKLQNWYSSNITGANASKVSSGNYFCEAAKVTYPSYPSNIGSATLVSKYNYTPDLKCANDGNSKGKVNASVGLITYDEMVLAGSYSTADSSGNDKYYLYNNTQFWTMSPAGYNSNTAMVWKSEAGGRLSDNNTTVTNYIRPVINLKADTVVTKDSNTGHYIVQ